MKSITGLMIISGLIAIMVNFLNDPNKNHNPLFEQQMAGALNLRRVSSSSLYRSSWLKIFNDTIVGYHDDYKPDSCYFFIQSLKNLSYEKHISAAQLVHPCKNCGFCGTCIGHIDAFRNQCIYTAKYGRSTMLKACSDGTVTQYFGKYDKELFYANKILLYKQKAVITSYNGIYIFDILSQKLLWEYKYDLDNGLSAIVGNKLAFVYINEKDRLHVKTFLVGVDLDSLKTIWTKVFNGGFSGLGSIDDIGKPYHELKHTANEIRFNGDLGISIIDVNTGRIKYNYNFIGTYYILDSARLYASYKTLRCYNLKTHAQVWKVDDFNIVEEYKSNIIGRTVDEKFYVVVDKLTGKIKGKIVNPNFKDVPVRVIGKYVLFNGKDLYQ